MKKKENKPNNPKATKAVANKRNTAAPAKRKLAQKPAPARKAAPAAKKPTAQSPSAKKKTVTKPVSTKQKAQTKPQAPKAGTKADYMTKHGIKIRPVTAKDRQCAKTDYQRAAGYVISVNGKEYFSTKGSLADCKAVVQWTKNQAGGKNAKK